MKNKVQPIKPEEVESEKLKILPDEVFAAFNEIIVKNYHNRSSNFKQKEVVKIMTEKGLKSKEIFENGWLDVEELYRKQGWIVEYDRPAYNEDYEANFTFKKK